MTTTDFLLMLDGIVEVAPGTIKIDQPLSEYPSWDSLALITFQAEVDAQFGETVDPAALVRCKTPADLAALVGDQITAG